MRLTNNDAFVLLLYIGYLAWVLSRDFKKRFDAMDRRLDYINEQIRRLRGLED